MTALAARFRNASRTSQVLVVLIALHVLLKAFLLTQVGRVRICCDQVSYDDGARALSNLVRDLVSFGPIHTEELQRNLVGGGWFTPGSSIMLAPLYVVDPHASTFAVRFYLGLFSTLLLLFTVSRVRRTLGDLYAIVLMVIPGLMPMWLLFSFSAWGDLVAGLLATILLMELIQLMRTLVAGRAPTARAGLRFGLAAIVTVYARSSTSLLIIGMGVVLGATALLVLRGRIRWTAVVSLGLAGLTFLAILAPWSIFASTTLKSRVLTTTTVPIVLANTFGDRDRVCFGPCDPVQDPGSTLGNIWFPPMQYSREVARATGRSEVQVEKQMWTYTRPSITAHSYTHDVMGDFKRYAAVPASFARLLLPPGADDGFGGWLVYVTAYLGWGVAFLSALALMLTVPRRSRDHAVISLITTLSLGTLFTQPFVHIGTGRYWTTAAPLGAIALALLISMVDARRAHPRLTAAPVTLGGLEPELAGSDPGAGSGVRTEAVQRWLTVAQVVLAVGTALVVILVPVLGI